MSDQQQDHLLKRLVEQHLREPSDDRSLDALLLYLLKLEAGNPGSAELQHADESIVERLIAEEREDLEKILAWLKGEQE
ncbi:hypothetical protein [Alkalibacillus aidingensis]|uniref:hypothetical protein n=1 Tax=Alkalibacillus aidingensis TaxID=2747607 RepID=UPI0016606BDB|nr:hypothetical protein [Alkalibacillus aidingensis]